jgi:hypothetical protein
MRSTASENLSTRLISAVIKGNVADVITLLDAGASVHARCNDRIGNTALNIAAGSGYTQIVIILLSRGADVNLPNKGGIPALNIAVYHGHPEVVDVLLQNHANAYVVHPNGDTVLSLAAVKKDTTILQMLLNHLAVNAERYPVECVMAAETRSKQTIMHHYILALANFPAKFAEVKPALENLLKGNSSFLYNFYNNKIKDKLYLHIVGVPDLIVRLNYSALAIDVSEDNALSFLYHLESGNAKPTNKSGQLKRMTELHAATLAMLDNPAANLAGPLAQKSYPEILLALENAIRDHESDLISVFVNELAEIFQLKPTSAIRDALQHLDQKNKMDLLPLFEMALDELAHSAAALELRPNPRPSAPPYEEIPSAPPLTEPYGINAEWEASSMSMQDLMIAAPASIPPPTIEPQEENWAAFFDSLPRSRPKENSPMNAFDVFLNAPAAVNTPAIAQLEFQLLIAPQYGEPTLTLPEVESPAQKIAQPVAASAPSSIEIAPDSPRTLALLELLEAAKVPDHLPELASVVPNSVFSENKLKNNSKRSNNQVRATLEYN